MIGSGGREHAFVWKLASERSVSDIVCAPGNAGISQLARCVHADVTDPRALVGLATREQIDFTIVGPEVPLSRGVADAFAAEALLLLGPTERAAQLESSKAFAKAFMQRHGIPTARYRTCESAEQALSVLRRSEFDFPVVLKADGLAAGKGVTVAMTRAEAEGAIEAAGDGALVIEEFLSGEEASLFALVDGETATFLATAQDHKRAGEGDTGPNTGGMGAYAPAPVLTPELEARAMEEIVRPTARAMAAAGTPFSGLLYAGLMLTADGPKLIEYNVRFGDPECEAVMPLIDGDFAQMLCDVATGKLAEMDPPRLAARHAMTVVVAARGYPGAPASGGAIRLIEAAEQVEGVTVFHAGTTLSAGDLVAKGGRVLAVTAVADTFANARARAYRGIDQIDFADGFHRRDIGWRELERAS